MAVQTTEDLQNALNALVACAEECERCSDHCLRDQMPETARSCRDCADICWLCSAFASRGSDYVKQIFGVCADICEACARACDSCDDQECRRCAEACRSCAEQCQKIAA
jgi:hypothetical protein